MSVLKIPSKRREPLIQRPSVPSKTTGNLCFTAVKLQTCEVDVSLTHWFISAATFAVKNYFHHYYLLPNMCKTMCRAPYGSSAPKRVLQDLFGFPFLAILLTRSLRFFLRLPLYSSTVYVLSSSIIFSFRLWPHFVQPAVRLINSNSAAVILVSL
jgi:hypothetical protein